MTPYQISVTEASPRTKRMPRIGWSAVAGVLAAVTAIVLHLLHVIETEVLSVITLVLLTAMFLQSLRSAPGRRRIAARVGSRRTPAGPARPEREAAGHRGHRTAGPAAGECRLLAGRQGKHGVVQPVPVDVRASTARRRAAAPGYQEPVVTAVIFVRTRDSVRSGNALSGPRCRPATRRARSPTPFGQDCQRTPGSFLADTLASGATECLLSFWGEPFMVRSMGHGVPRYVFLLTGHSELNQRLVALAGGHLRTCGSPRTPYAQWRGRRRAQVPVEC